jgi:sarcosine oxidase subunit alpha
MTQRLRLRSGGRIDRAKRLRFTFDGRSFQGYEGDTLASALLANGVSLVGRSFKYHRPRGILASGAEEPNALVQIGRGGRGDPNLRATQVELYDGLSALSVNRWPSLHWDAMAVLDRLSPILPAGFYYKTFMWPRGLWGLYEWAIRHAAGLGRAPPQPDPDRYEKVHTHCDVLVVGAGPAGLSAALAAGRAGARVLIVDEQAEAGGSLLATRQGISGAAAAEWAAQSAEALAALPEVNRLTRTTAFGYYDHNYVLLLERVTDHLPVERRAAATPRQRLWKVRAKQVVLAAGAIERPLVFDNNDRPGIMLAGAAQVYVKRYAVRAGARVVVATNNDSAYDAAYDLAGAGIKIAAVVDTRPYDREKAAQLEAIGVPLWAGHRIVAAQGRRRVRGVRVEPVGGVVGSNIRCDLVAMSGGWSPTVHLFSQSGGRLQYDESEACFVPLSPLQEVRCAGAANASFGLGDCLREGTEAGAAAAAGAGFALEAQNVPVVSDRVRTPIDPAWAPKPGTDGKAFVDFHTDVTANDIELAAAEGYVSVEHLKRYTTAGMGPDQGKTGNVNALALLAEIRGSGIANVGTTTFRPPYTPVTYGALAGRDIGSFADPVRRTPMDDWHEGAGAVFENVGQWRRPFYYPGAGEDKQAAVRREALAARSGVVLLDASTLGKIAIKGEGARALLNLIYTNAWDKLAIGRCRYGLMLGEDGMVFDDGVTARLSENHYLMMTTTGNAGRVMDWMEDWLQCEWPNLPVFLTSVTTQWATVAVSGPNARALLAGAAEGIDLDGEAFPHMSVRMGRVAGLPARVFRVSYTGELSYEVNVPASAGLALWQALLAAGEALGVCPIGTEALHVLRAEKGYIAVGQDTDGSVTPGDLGMGWAVSKTKDFIGKRSLARGDTARAGRKQLVGLLTDDPACVVPEGAHVVAEMKERPPMKMLGHVTSSYMSPNLGRSIALALLADGRAKRGARVALAVDGRPVQAVVTDSVFVDPQGVRLNA